MNELYTAGMVSVEGVSHLLSNPLNQHLDCYLITEEELTDNVGEIIDTAGESVTVNSEKSGRTNLVGTVEFNGGLLKLDAETDRVYTSIQWNPVPKDKAKAAAFTALVGQTIEVVGQLVDQNGNAVTVPGVAINFQQGGSNISSGASTVTMAKGVNTTDATVVDITNNGKTDSKGQVTMILKSADFAAITDISADSGSKSYDVKLNIAGKAVENADLYWVDQDLEFVDTVVGTPTKVFTDNTNISVSSNEARFGATIEPKAGTNWMYAMKIKGQSIDDTTNDDYGSLDGKTITIDKLKIQMSQGNGGVGSVDVNTGVNGMVKATSTKVGLTKIVGKINSDSVVDGAVESDIYTFAGKGTTSINKRLTLGVTWKNDGITAEIVTPTGTRVSGTSTTVFAKVVDTIGNVISGNKVTFKVENGKLNGRTTDVEAVTNKDGIATVTLTSDGTNARSTVNVKVDGVSDNVFTKTYTWVATPNGFTVDTSKDEDTERYKAVFDKEAGTVTMVFTDEIVESSVVASALEVLYGKSGSDPVKLAISNVTVKGDTVVIKLSNVPSTIDANAYIQVNFGTDKVKSVDYSMTSVDGVRFIDKVYFKLDGSQLAIGDMLH